jgi:hypothetical protein
VVIAAALELGMEQLQETIRLRPISAFGWIQGQTLRSPTESGALPRHSILSDLILLSPPPYHAKGFAERFFETWEI